ncbi:MAG: ATP-dependent RNA helicase [Oceanospirillaceae bacterium]|nr:ATP-dependent RNA helicase [Oceanospirillaceae bacterium]MBL33923.1 ATP-dependent RNA helicase [Oceanospirillaceae bacterium]MBS54276.1 ATP-dependent RNA helicase [Oceanospirillaceae bacterium]|tara:strand:- start:1981 stop:3723 length:1743 start_codon:yes stop_codon:yes gene_type:complete
MTLFSDLDLCDPILRAVSEQGYSTPSPVQAQAIPAVLAGRDVMAAAQTGTGKTAGFTLPMLQRLQSGKRAGANRIRALVLTPTRELAAQVGENVVQYSQYLQLNSTVVFGGVGINPQMKALRGGVDVLVACPGRLLDLYQQNAVRFDQVEFLVLDEADRMLDMGFIHDIKKILKLLPAKRQNLLFSATFSKEIRDLAKGLVNDPVEIDVSPRNSTAHTIEQWLVPADKKQKSALLTRLLQDNKWHQVLVFTRTKHGANRLATHLEKNNIRAAAIHGNKSQGARTRALAEFKSGDIAVLVATDIAARGLDIEQLPYVVNFELPNVAADYVHRIGRTGRAGASGQALSLVCAEELEDLEGIEGLIGKEIERRTLAGFEPVVALPVSRPRKPKKPKKAKAPRTDDQQRSADNRGGQGRNGQGRSEQGRNEQGRKNNARRGDKARNGNKSEHNAANNGNRSRRGGAQKPTDKTSADGQEKRQQQRGGKPAQNASGNNGADNNRSDSRRQERRSDSSRSENSRAENSRRPQKRPAANSADAQSQPAKAAAPAKAAVNPYGMVAPEKPAEERQQGTLRRSQRRKPS